MSLQQLTLLSSLLISLSTSSNLLTRNFQINTTTMSQPRFFFTSMHFLLFLSLFLLFHSSCYSLTSFNSLKHSSSAELDHVIMSSRRVCRKRIGDCLTTETEMEMDSESNRRILAMQKKYISYETLKRDMVPCDRAGASYYNCHSTQAHPYNRGCEVITACARGS